MSSSVGAARPNDSHVPRLERYAAPRDSSSKRTRVDDTRTRPAYQQAAPFPFDIFHDDCSQPTEEESIAAFHARLSAIKRVAVHSERRRNAASLEPGHFGIYLIDCEGNEYPFLRFQQAANAAYAALRIAEVYRLGVEFGNFKEPKLIGDPQLLGAVPC
ncbi:hypothetical protein D7S89_00770 [Trinickia fusca]|uniref:Uncharacterized protein n=2 Tax=Trinickia fusca TaxID=2419777 RepID=A0A494XN67_9BURK|nr:hypothetical protein D7S89_00770 [Trinickia fusca]